jgi:hypothetical protein
MTPEELADRHPKLYHVTESGAWSSIKRNGLLSTRRLLDLFEIKNPQREILETKRRPAAVPIQHHHYGTAILNDNAPLSEEALAKCLDDHLTPADWLRILNARVFFWTNEESLNRHLGARLNRTRFREVMIVDTLSLAKAHLERIELSPINSGVTFRKAARRGMNTFTPLLKYSYSQWSIIRGRKDKIQEVTVLDQVRDTESYVIDVIQTP